eukprot:m.153290 g.153290  ORF g.153290 m.153290 type:complete len:333 (-) comp16367_c0_seq2:1999-2997(-)
MAAAASQVMAQPLGDGRQAWLFDKSHLVDTCPSIQDGKTYEELSDYKYRAFDFAHRIVDALSFKGRLAVLATTMQLVHRFYVYQSIVDFHWLPVTQAALFAALKIEETVIKTDNLLKWAYYMKQKVMNASDKSKKIEKLLPDSKQYFLLKEQLHRHERILLQTVGFNFNIELPAPYVIHMMRALKRKKWIAQDVSMRSYTRTAWYWCSASYGHHDLCLIYGPVALAVALFYGVVKQCKLEITPTSTGSWWRHLFDDYKDTEVLDSEIPSEATCIRMLQLLDPYDIAHFLLAHKASCSPSTTLRRNTTCLDNLLKQRPSPVNVSYLQRTPRSI